MVEVVLNDKITFIVGILIAVSFISDFALPIYEAQLKNSSAGPIFHPFVLDPMAMSFITAILFTIFSVYEIKNRRIKAMSESLFITFCYSISFSVLYWILIWRYTDLPYVIIFWIGLILTWIFSFSYFSKYMKK